MTSKRYTLLVLVIVAALAAGYMLFNVWSDDFGLYGDPHGKERRVWTYNRASKYLLALKFIPANFDGVLIGSSSSATMLDTRRITGHRIYNLSLNGANICEVAPAALKALESGRMRYVVICLDPYLTQDSMMKTSELQPHLERYALGSLFMLRFQLYKLWYRLHPGEDAYRDSWWGYRLALPSERRDMTAGFKEDPAGNGPGEKPVVDPAALACLRRVVDAAHQRGTAVIAYFHPRSEPNLRNMDYGDFRRAMLKLFRKNDRIVDMTGPDYAYIRKDPAAYYDNVHLSAKGAAEVLDALQRELDRIGR